MTRVFQHDDVRQRGENARRDHGPRAMPATLHRAGRVPVAAATADARHRRTGHDHRELGQLKLPDGLLRDGEPGHGLLCGLLHGDLQPDGGRACRARQDDGAAAALRRQATAGLPAAVTGHTTTGEASKSACTNLRLRMVPLTAVRDLVPDVVHHQPRSGISDPPNQSWSGWSTHYRLTAI